MYLSRRSLVFLLLIVLGLFRNAAVAQTNYTSVVVFGDSLSDTGNVAHLTESQYGVRYPADNRLLGINYTDGRFTDGTDTQPAASKAYTGIWVEQLATLFGTSVTIKNSLDGGTNYAYGDATTGSGTTTESKTFLGQTFTLTLNNMGQQVTDYLNSHPAPNAGTLYVLWGGSNDILNTLDTPGSDPVAAAQIAVGNELGLVQQLIAAGATSFLIPNVPPLGAIAQAEGAPAATVTALNNASAAFAVGLATGLNALKQGSMNPALTLYQPDIISLFSSVAANPESYAFGNLTTRAQGVSGSPDTYLIWDGLHPTTTGHHFVAAAAANLFSPLASSTTALSVPSASLSGQPVAVTATVKSGKTGDVPTGLVTLFDGTAAVGSAPVDASGAAQITFTPTEAAGATLSLAAVYAGDVINDKSAPATGTISLLNAAIGTTTALSTSNANANLGDSITFTATVTPAVTTAGSPAGTVTFSDGSTTLGTGTLSNGTAAYITSSLSAGSHTITATYAANGVFGASTSAGVTETITAPGFTVQASPSSLTVNRGASGTVNFTVTPTGGFTGTTTPACGTLPAHFSCTFAAPTNTSSDGTRGYVLTIATNASSTATTASSTSGPNAQGARIWLASLSLPGLLGLAGLASCRRKGMPRLMVLCAGAALSAGLLGLAGCGDGSSNNAARGNYTVPVVFSASGGSGSTSVASQTVNITVTVQ